MAFPDLSGAQDAVEGLLTNDVGRLERYTRGTTRDPVSLEYPETRKQLYQGGCVIRILASEAILVESEEREVVLTARAILPVRVTDVKKGDVFTVVSCKRDAWLNGRKLVVDGVGGGSFSVARVLSLKEYTDDAPSREQRG